MWIFYRTGFLLAVTALLFAPSMATAAEPEGELADRLQRIEAVSKNIERMTSLHLKLARAKERLLDVDEDMLGLLQETIRELLSEKEALRIETKGMIAGLGGSDTAADKELLARIKSIELSIKKMAGVDPNALPPYVTKAKIPVAGLLKKLGVKPALIESQSLWCECLEDIAHERTTDGGFITVDGEKFPALAALPPPPIPVDNPQVRGADGFPPDGRTSTDPKVVLGRQLFFDVRLSGDNSVSCATCHAPDQGWGLNSNISRGYPGTSHWRNSHTVVNSVYMWKLFWAGSSLALNVQAKSANTGLSGNGKTDMMEERIRQCPDYVKQFKEVFGTEVPLLEDSWRAIAAFQRALVQPDTPFDLYMKGDKEALDEQQIRGLALFEGKAGCVKCHNGPMFTDQKYYNLGIPQQESFLEDPIQQITHRFQYFSKGATEEAYRNGKHDLGVYFSTKRKADIGKFRTQTLRYLEYTPPYMHNGVFDTLKEVVEFYNEGGKENWTEKTFGIDNKSPRMKKLGLTPAEIDDIVAFLASLSGEELLMARPILPNPMSFVYVGETYVGLPIPEVSLEVDPTKKKAPEKYTWALLSAPEGATIDANTGRVVWKNVTVPADGKPITITIQSTSSKGVKAEQTLELTVLPKAPQTASTGGAAR